MNADKFASNLTEMIKNAKIFFNFFNFFPDTRFFFLQQEFFFLQQAKNSCGEKKLNSHKIKKFFLSFLGISNHFYESNAVTAYYLQ